MATGTCNTFFLPHVLLWSAAAFWMLVAVGWEIRPWPRRACGRSAQSGTDPCPLLGDVCMCTFSLWV